MDLKLMKNCKNSWRYWFRIIDLRSTISTTTTMPPSKFLLMALIFTLTLNLHKTDAGTSAPNSSGGSAPTTNVDNENFNCSSTNGVNGEQKPVSKIKGAGFPIDQNFMNKKLTTINCVEGDDGKTCELNVICGGNLGKKENLAIVLPMKFLSRCSSSSDVLTRAKSESSMQPNVIFVYVSDSVKSRDDLKNELASMFTTPNANLLRAFLPETVNDEIHNLFANLKTANVSCDVNTVIDDASQSPPDSILNNFSRTSVLFVSVSFIILMVISLAWLVFYYVQRFRYAHAKDRLARRLFNAAKKALTKIPNKTLRQGDRELDSDCPVCIEPYHTSDVIRTLPCKHVFHKTCVDPWLLEHRTCPMCKMDILKAFGYNFGHSEESVRDADQLSAGGQSTDGRGVGFPVPLPTDSDLHDPFFPSPAPSPSLLQPVLHSNNTQSFSIIPLTVHNSGARGSDSSADSSEHWVSERHSAEVHRGPLGDNSSAASSSGSEDGHELRAVTQPLFRPSRPSSSSIVARSSKNSKNHRRKSTKSITAAANNNAATTASSTISTSATMASNNNNNNVVTVKLKNVNRPRSASSQNLGPASIVDPPIADGRISCGLRNETAPSLESL